MLGISVHGLLGVDADLQRSAFAVLQEHNMVEYHSPGVEPRRHGDCNQYAPPGSRTRT